MFDAPYSSYQRSHGLARVTLGAGGRISGLFQQGSAKAMVPRTHGSVPEVVFLNTSGGLTGGDTLQFSLAVAAGEAVSGATQTAERVYASAHDVAKVDVTLSVEQDATLFWLPQETILFEGAALDRTTKVHLGEGARFVGLETVVLGRAHMGETVESIDFRDARQVFGADGRIVHAEHIVLDDTVLERAASPAGLQAATVLATLICIAPEAEHQLEAVRRLLPGNASSFAATALDNRLIVRALGHDSWDLRAGLIPAIRYLTGGHIPRVWQL